MPVNRDIIGERGEWIAQLLLTRRFDRPNARFRARFLGEKHPIIDLFAELVGSETDVMPFFVAQVKATSLGYNAQGDLRIQIPSHRLMELAKYPAPTYVIGVDEVAERAFIMAVLTGRVTNISGLSARYSLTEEQTLDDLYNEVQSFWTAHATRFTKSQFT